MPKSIKSTVATPVTNFSIGHTTSRPSVLLQIPTKTTTKTTPLFHKSNRLQIRASAKPTVSSSAQIRAHDLFLTTIAALSGVIVTLAATVLYLVIKFYRFKYEQTRLNQNQIELTHYSASTQNLPYIQQVEDWSTTSSEQQSYVTINDQLSNRSNIYDVPSASIEHIYERPSQYFPTDSLGYIVPAQSM